jgi:membrane fusion protein (multidrug efflux system)
MNESKTAPRNGKRPIQIGVGLIVSLGLLITVYWFFFMRGYVKSDDARFDADLVDIAPQVGGTLERIFIREGDSVQIDQSLFQLDTEALEAAAARADAAVASARATLAVASANHEKSVRGPREEEIRMAEATEAKTAAQETLAHSDWERVKGLYENGAISESERDHARTQWETVKHTHEEALQQLKLMKKGTRREDLAVSNQNVELARSQLAAAAAAARQAHISLEQAEVKAPFDGIVVRIWLDPGSAVSPGRPVLTLLNPTTMHISANIEEKQLAMIAVGDPVEISVDAYPKLDLHGQVSTILRATNSQFSLVPSEGVSGTFVKVSQRVPLRIDLEQIPDEPLSPGLSVEISIDIHHRRKLTALAQRHE